MTPAEMLAQAAEAEREARTLWNKIETARGDSDALIPAGCEHEVQRASDLMRHARALRADAAEIAQESASAPTPQSNSTSTAGARALPLPSTPAVEEPEDTVEAVAARIINSDSAAPGQCRSPAQVPGAAGDLAAIVARILKA